MLELTGNDWKKLRLLRDQFIETQNPPHSYWIDDRTLDLYHHTFGQRILWKWHHVLNGLKSLQWAPEETVLDWGCGSGIASRAVFDYYPSIKRIYLHDRKEAALSFARRQLGQLSVEITTGRPEGDYTLLISHVRNELHPSDLRRLLATVHQAKSVIWIEPGTPENSKELVSLRESLKKDFSIVAPCPKLERCPLTNTETSHWCHQYAAVPSEVFTSGFWRRWGNEMGIDLRSLPLSYLVLDKNEPSRRFESQILGRGKKSIHCTPMGFSDAGL